MNKAGIVGGLAGLVAAVSIGCSDSTPIKTATSTPYDTPIPPIHELTATPLPENSDLLKTIMKLSSDASGQKYSGGSAFGQYYVEDNYVLNEKTNKVYKIATIQGKVLALSDLPTDSNLNFFLEQIDQKTCSDLAGFYFSNINDNLVEVQATSVFCQSSQIYIAPLNYGFGMPEAFVAPPINDLFLRFPIPNGSQSAKGIQTTNPKSMAVQLSRSTFGTFEDGFTPIDAPTITTWFIMDYIPTNTLN